MTSEPSCPVEIEKKLQAVREMAMVEGIRAEAITEPGEIILIADDRLKSQVTVTNSGGEGEKFLSRL